MTARGGPPDSEAGPRHRSRPTAENTTTTTKQPQSTSAEPRAWRDALDRRSGERVRELRQALDRARRRGDPSAVGLLAAWLDAEYVSRSHVRAADPEVRRLRRQLRGAA